MKDKLFVLIVIVIILTGCTANYNLEIKDGNFFENVSIFSDNKSSLSYFKNNKIYAIMDGASNFKEYEKKLSSDGKNGIVKLKYNYNLNDFRKSTAIKSCFKAYNVIDENNYYIISTSKGLKCGKEENANLLDSVKIIIKTNHKVMDNNADEVNGYSYVWNFSKNDYDDKSVYLKIYKDKYVVNYDNELTINVVVISSIIFMLIIGIIVTVKKVKKSREV